MPSRIIRKPEELDGWLRFLRLRKCPMTVSVIQGAKRTLAQNSTIHMWFADIASQTGDMPDEVKAHCNATYGVPILRRDDLEWQEAVWPVLEPLSYEGLRKFIRYADVPITRGMTSAQLTEYMDQMRRDYSAADIVLRDPELRKYEQ